MFARRDEVGPVQKVAHSALPCRAAFPYNLHDGGPFRMNDAIIGLYQRHAAAWDADRDRSLFERPWLERFVEGLASGATILDLGCGSGEPIGRWLVERGFAVTGLDSSPTLIALCQARLADAEWLVGDMRQLSLGRRFDAILAWHSFFHLALEDQRAMFARFADHAVPGARLMFTSGPEEGEAIGTYRGEPLYHASLAPSEYRRLLAAAGFGPVAHSAQDPDCGGATIWLAQKAQPPPTNVTISKSSPSSTST